MALNTNVRFHDVVVTGFAATTAIAADAEQTWTALLAGASGIEKLEYPFIEQFGLPVHIGGPLREDIASQVNRVEARRMTRVTQMATLLGRRAWTHAAAPDIDTRRLSVAIGQGYGTTHDLVELYDNWQVRGMRAASPLTVQMHMPNAAAAAVGLERKAKAGVITPMVGDASGTAAIGEAWRLLALGEADMAICGGVESAIEATPLAAFSNAGWLSTRNDDPEGACRPFDRDRDGTVLSEGGALLVLETEEHAKSRGAQIFARVLGYGLSFDPSEEGTFDPTGESEGEAILRALRAAGLTPADVDHVNAHATGTRDGDRSEAAAIRSVFGAHHPAVYAPKAALGQSMGATGAIEAIVTVQTLRDNVIPPTRNLHRLDPEFDLDVVAGQPRSGDYQCAVSTSFGIGAVNAAVVFGRY
ncbi:KasA/KasB family beta-ketoacyl-ACP synthase [Mycolicibacterium sp. 120266]|uniref:KasA/KasB family beta-ketoacyl-ACP synthase n=1 Tax=Mycolicibacterium sp. 120266 TaxID=3090601 RepID=UPI00299E207D|nr:KasA/KasB family beta-ketoacyl-ACP synthase [Mycolicibacterium sp. 120266]MDX1873399.1 KasA/KasB family beta-ketoacyl-ACP synthase [Mycolicibacterium sp. 120266]